MNSFLAIGVLSIGLVSASLSSRSTPKRLVFGITEELTSRTRSNRPVIRILPGRIIEATWLSQGLRIGNLVQLLFNFLGVIICRPLLLMEELRYLALELLRLPGDSVLERRRLRAIHGPRTIDQARRWFIQLVREFSRRRRTIWIFDLHVTPFLLSIVSTLLLDLIRIIRISIALICFWCVHVASHRVQHRCVLASRTALSYLVGWIYYLLELMCLMVHLLVILDCYDDFLGALRIIIVIFILIWLSLDISILGLGLFILFHYFVDGIIVFFIQTNQSLSP